MFDAHSRTRREDTDVTAFALDSLDAIDVHVHVEQDSHGCTALDQELLDASAKYFRAEQARQHADVLIPFGSVDPHTGKAAVARARRLVTEHGVRGFTSPARTPARPPSPAPAGS